MPESFKSSSIRMDVNGKIYISELSPDSQLLLALLFNYSACPNPSLASFLFPYLALSTTHIINSRM